MIELFAEEPVPLWRAELLRMQVGGDTLNVAVAAARLGSSAAFITRVGDDPFAQALLTAWQREGIDISAVRVVPGFNAVYFISVAESGERHFTYYRRGSAASTLEPSDVPEQLVRRAKVVHFSGITQAISPSARAACRRLIHLAQRSGAAVSYDPNFRPALWTAAEAREAMAEVLAAGAIAFPSAGAEAAALFGTDDFRAIAEKCLAAGARLVAVKMGAEGCFVTDGREELHVPAAPACEVLDTTGAGDAFVGAFVHAWLRGASLLEAAQLANIAGALACCKRGALAGLPTAEQAAEEWQRIYGPPPSWLQ